MKKPAAITPGGHEKGAPVRPSSLRKRSSSVGPAISIGRVSGLQVGPLGRNADALRLQQILLRQRLAVADRLFHELLQALVAACPKQRRRRLIELFPVTIEGFLIGHGALVAISPTKRSNARISSGMSARAMRSPAWSGGVEPPTSAK